jgi:hypothetical protein
VKPRTVKWLFLKFFLFLIVGLILWTYFQLSYSKLLISASQVVLSWTEKGEETSLRLQRNMILFIPLGLVSKEKKEADVPVGGRDVRSIHYNSVILFALIFFTPGISLGKRGWVLILGFALLFFTQVLTVVVQVKFFYAFQLSQYSVIHYGSWGRNIYGFLKQFFELVGRFSFPFVIWMGFTYREVRGFLTG